MTVKETHAMDTMEFRKLMEVLDKEADEAKREWEAKARREALEQRRRLLLYWKEKLETKRAEFAKYQASPSIDIEAKLSEIAAELQAIESPEGPEPSLAVVVDARTVAEMKDLIREIQNTSLDECPYPERGYILKGWALRWRLAILCAPDAAKHAVLKAAYAAILGTRDQWAKGLTLPGLSKDCGGDFQTWSHAYRVNAVVYAEWKQQRETEDRFAKASAEALSELETFLRASWSPTEEFLKTLRHLARKAASYPHLRPEVAQICAERKDALGEEFLFLWSDGRKEDSEEQPSKRITNAEMIARILRRLKSKDMVGACHAPADMVTQGFPGHDYGRAEEALAALVKGGIVRRRKTGIGIRVSLEPGMMAEVDAAIEGKCTGIEVVDEWTAKDAS